MRAQYLWSVSTPLHARAWTVMSVNFEVWFYQQHHLRLTKRFFPKRLVSFYSRNMSNFSKNFLQRKSGLLLIYPTRARELLNMKNERIVPTVDNVTFARVFACNHVTTIKKSRSHPAKLHLKQKKHASQNWLFPALMNKESKKKELLKSFTVNNYCSWLRDE